MVVVTGGAAPMLVRGSVLSLATPVKNDAVHVMTGPHRDRSELLIGTDLLDAVFKMDDNMEILIIELRRCAAFNPAWASLTHPLPQIVLSDDEDDADWPRYDPALYQG